MPKFKYIPKTVNKNSAMSLREKLKKDFNETEERKNLRIKNRKCEKLHSGVKEIFGQEKIISSLKMIN